jgi:hypothetical protein
MLHPGSTLIPLIKRKSDSAGALACTIRIEFGNRTTRGTDWGIETVRHRTMLRTPDQKS